MHSSATIGKADAIDGMVEPVRFDVQDLDPSMDPFADLDAFVNSRWRAANPVPPDRSGWDCFSILHERSLQVQKSIAIDAAGGRLSGEAARVVGDLWASGMRAACGHSVVALREELETIESLASAAAVVAYIVDRHARGWPVLFGFDVTADFDDPSSHIACVDQGGLGVDNPGFHLDPGKKALREAYAGHLAALLRWHGLADVVAQQLARRVLAFERRLAAAWTAPQTLARDIALRQQPMTLAEAGAITSSFSWAAFFERMGVAAPPRFSLAMPAFHCEWNAMLTDTSVRDWRAYLICRTIASMAAHASGELAAIHHSFHGAIVRGQASPTPHWKQVVATINAHAGTAMGELYVARAFSGRALDAARELVDRLRPAFRARLLHLDWMAEETRSYAVRKLDAMRASIGHPACWRDWSELHTMPDDWLGNLLAVRAHEQAWKLGRISKAVDTDEWRMAPQTVNAGYDPQRNQIVFPAALLQPPFFDEQADDALNYGGIGAVIAHEMTHAFDDQGSHFGIDGRFENWWSDEDRRRFQQRAQSLVALFDATKAMDGSAVDGRLTLGENIADFGGLAIACDAFRQRLRDDSGADRMHDGFTQAQRFFLAWATIWRQNLTEEEARRLARIDPHAPAALRANVPPTSLPEFAQAFGAPFESIVDVRIW